MAAGAAATAAATAAVTAAGTATGNPAGDAVEATDRAAVDADGTATRDEGTAEETIRNEEARVVGMTAAQVRQAEDRAAPKRIDPSGA
jgi:hypothetical protein